MYCWIEAVCQIANNGIPHNCANLDPVTVTQRAQGPDQGYILSYTGGDENRKSQIEFICDRNATDLGTFSFVKENPIHFYQFSWYKDPRPPLCSFERESLHPPPSTKSNAENGAVYNIKAMKEIQSTHTDRQIYTTGRPSWHVLPMVAMEMVNVIAANVNSCVEE